MALPMLPLLLEQATKVWARKELEGEDANAGT